jgi:hypothetical protein
MPAVLRSHCGIAIVVLLLAFATSCCGNEDVAEHPSPDGTSKYVTFSRNCGATTGFNVQISVLPARRGLPAHPGNTFIGDDDHGAAPFVARAQWVSNELLQVTVSKRARIYKKEAHVGAISIRYVEE